MDPFRFLTENIRHHNMGSQRLFRFANGFGASVVKHCYSYGGEEGLYELAVISWDSPVSWKIEYDTDVTSNVLGGLALEDVENALRSIMNLDPIQRELSQNDS